MFKLENIFEGCLTMVDLPQRRGAGALQNGHAAFGNAACVHITQQADESAATDGTCAAMLLAHNFVLEKQ